MRRVLPWLSLVMLGLAGCGGSSGAPAQDAGANPQDDAAVAVDAGADASKAAMCAATFGTELTASFGRVDGTVVAVVGPTDTQCPKPNSDHLVVQVLMHGAAYRMVVNVLSNTADPRVALACVSAPLAGPAWAEGWHTDAPLDYVTNLGVHSDAFTPHPMDELVSLVTAEIAIGARISVFATSSGGTYADSTHLVHRNRPNADGAIVLDPDGASPRYLLFRFPDQSF